MSGKLKELYTLIEDQGKKLNGAELKQEGSTIIIIDEAAESSDDAFVWEGYGVYEAYAFLEANGYLAP